MLRRLRNPGWENKQHYHSATSCYLSSRFPDVMYTSLCTLTSPGGQSYCLFLNRNLTGVVRLEGGDSRKPSYSFLSASKVIDHLFIDKYPVSSEKEVATKRKTPHGHLKKYWANLPRVPSMPTSLFEVQNHNRELKVLRSEIHIAGERVWSEDLLGETSAPHRYNRKMRLRIHHFTSSYQNRKAITTALEHDNVAKRWFCD